jgi:hypothetical protein
MKIVKVASLLLALTGAGAALADSKRGPAAGPCDGHSFDPARIERVSGRIAEIGKAGKGHHERGAHAWIDTSSGRVEVMLGPADYVKAQTVRLASGDQVEVSGWRMKMGRGEMLVASEVRRGSEVLLLRDQSGAPAWTAPGSRGGPDEEHPCGSHSEHEHESGEHQDHAHH